MAKAVRQPPIQASSRKRYSLRTLFLVSGAVAVPFLLLTNLQHQSRPEDSVASPLYLLLGVTLVLLAASIGGALGQRTGMILAAGMAALSWVVLAFAFSEFSKELKAVLPVHAICAIATAAVLAAVVRTVRESPEEGPDGMLARLLKVKSDVRRGQRMRGASSDVEVHEKLDDPAEPPG